MSSEYIQSKEELQQHLKDTIQALELSSRSFDGGFEGEANRLAAAIRVLVHDTGSSKSLLGQLGQKSIKFYETSIPRNPRNIMTYSGLTAIELTSEGAKYVAVLDMLPPESPPRWVSFDEWWNRVIFVDQKGSETSRKDLILAVANKDGGAHLDPVLHGKYADLSRRNSLAWQFSSPRGDIPLEGPEKAAVRQITHEILKSLSPTMPMAEPKVTGSLLIGASAVVEEKQAVVPKVGRNDPCPCGSRKKYKHCHGKL
jgi:hypothetical protein